MSTALVKFLYKAADTRNDMATFGGAGAVAGAGLAGALNKDEDIKSKLIAMGLGGLAGGALGGAYGANKAGVNDAAKAIFTDTKESNPLTTGLGIGALTAGGMKATDALANSRGLESADANRIYGINTLKEYAKGGPISDPSINAILGADVSPELKHKFLSELAGREDQLVASILKGEASPGINPIRLNAARALNSLGMTDKADLIARREAVRNILSDDALLSSIKERLTPAGITPQEAETAKRLEWRKRKVEGMDPVAKLRAMLDAGELKKEQFAARSAPIESRHKLLLDRIKSRLAKVTDTNRAVLDSKGFVRSILENVNKAKPSAWRRYGLAGLGAGALGAIAAGMENKLRD